MFGRSISEKILTLIKHVNTSTHQHLETSSIRMWWHAESCNSTSFHSECQNEFTAYKPPRFRPCELYHPQCHCYWHSTIRLHFRNMCDPPLPNHTTWLTIKSGFPMREVKTEASHSPPWGRASERYIHVVRLHILEHWSPPGGFFILR